MALRINERFGDYRLLRFLGEGTFGDVYYGEHIYQHTPTAIKVFKTKLTPDKLKDFINEVRTVLLQHPNIVRILDFGIGDNDLPYLVMEYAPDGTLLQRHPRGTRLPLATVVTYVKQIASALQYAHDQRRIHRDVKPENILLGASNQVLLSDFGLAVVAHSPVSQRTEDKSGTALYMAPEQWQGKPLPATDQYALAIIVYEWLCGESPFVGNGLQLMYQHIYTAPAPLRSKVSTLSPEVEQVVMTALAKDPQRRFRNIQAFATALEQAMQPRKKPTGTLLWSYRSNTASMESLAWSPDSIYIASANAKECHIWNINHPNDHKILPFGANTLTWIQDGRRIGIKQKNKMLLVDVKTGDILSEIAVPFLPPDDEPDRDHTWSPNGVYISYTDGHTAPPLVLLDVEKTAQTYFDRNVFIHCWSPDGNFLAYIRANVVVLDTRTGSKRRLDNVFKGNIELAIFTICLSLSPTAALIAIENIADPNMQIWDVSTATCIFTQSLPKEESYRGYPLYPRSPADRQLVWSPSCKYLARKVRKEVQIWDIGAKQQIFSYQRHANTVLCVAWSPDGTCIASTDVDGVVHVWQAPS